MRSVTIWQRWLLSMLLYTLFLIPTGLLLEATQGNDALISRFMPDTWQCTFWHFPGLQELPSRVLLDALEAVAIGILGLLFYQGFQLLEPLPDAEQRRWVWLWTMGGCLLLLGVTPFHSSDILGYLNRGFQQTVYQINPYLVTVVEIPHWHASKYLHDHWIYNPCPYGFFFALLAKWITQCSQGSFGWAFLGFKLLNALCLLGSVWLIALLGKALNHQKPWLSAYLLGANPLALLHVMGNGHNDILMVALLLLAMVCSLKERLNWLVLPLLMLSILTKFASLLALPWLLWLLAKQRGWASLLVSLGLSALLFLALAKQYVIPGEHWPLAAMLENAGKPQHSLIALISEGVYYPLKWLKAPAKTWSALLLLGLKPLFWTGFVLFYLRRLWQGLRVPSASVTASIIGEIALSTTVMVAFISAKFHPWYTVMFLPLGLLLPWTSPLRQFILLTALFQLAGFTIFQNLPVISELCLTLLPLWLVFRRKTRLFLLETR